MRILAAVAVAVTWFTVQANAQTVIPNDVSCKRCRIVSQKLTRLGDLDGPGALPRQALIVTVDGRNRFWVGTGAVPFIFDSTGRFLRSAAGRGGGPGEIEGGGVPSPLPGDSMLVVDNVAARATVFDAAFRPIRTISIPRVLATATPIRWPDRVMFNSNIQTRELFGVPLHLIDLSGKVAEILRSSNGHNRDRSLPPASPPRSKFAVTADGRVWAAEESIYRLTQWNEDFEPIRVLVRKPSWWKQPSINLLGTRTTPPLPHIRDVSIDEDGLLWLFIHTPRSTWREIWSRIPEDAVEIRMDQLNPVDLFDTLIEVIDLSAARVVARARLSEYTVSALPGRRVATHAESPEGVPYVLIRRLSVAGR